MHLRSLTPCISGYLHDGCISTEKVNSREVCYFLGSTAARARSRILVSEEQQEGTSEKRQAPLTGHQPHFCYRHPERTTTPVLLIMFRPEISMTARGSLTLSLSLWSLTPCLSLSRPILNLDLWDASEDQCPLQRPTDYLGGVEQPLFNVCLCGPWVRISGRIRKIYTAKRRMSSSFRSRL